MWAEPFGAVGLELGHHGLPVVGFDAGGISDWLADGENGYLVPRGDEAAMADRLDRLLGDAALAQRLGARGRARALERYDQGRYLDELRALLDREAA
jgi:glycosyltransferase involved in cell wall biosynthesis